MRLLTLFMKIKCRLSRPKKDVKSELNSAGNCKDALKRYFGDFLLFDDPTGDKLTFV